MSRSAGVLALGLIAATALGLVAARPQPEATHEKQIAYTHFMEPPPSLPEMAQDVDAVVLGRILGGEAAGFRYNDKTKPGITTYYRFKVEEILRSSGAQHVDSKELVVVRDGGSRASGNRLDTLEVFKFPQFDSGKQYVLFLRWTEAHDAWRVAWEPHGTFEVVGGRIHSLGWAEVSKAQDGTALEEFLAKLRGDGMNHVVTPGHSTANRHLCRF